MQIKLLNLFRKSASIRICAARHSVLLEVHQKRENQMKMTLIVMMFGLGLPGFAFAYGGYCSIAFDTVLNSWGSSHGSLSAVEAHRGALASCKHCGRSIRQTWAMNGWVALALGKHHRWGLSTRHRDRRAAEISAIKNCGGSAYECAVVRSTSSFIKSPDIEGVLP